MIRPLCAMALAVLIAVAPAAAPAAAQAASKLSLGAAACYAVLSADAGATLALSGARTEVRGEVGLGASAVQDFTTGQIVGQFVVDPAATNTRANTVAIAGGTVKVSLAKPVSAAAAVATAIAAMQPTEKFPRITKTTAISSASGVNVVSIAGIALSGGATLTLTGSETDVFYVQMTGNVSLTQSAQIVLSGVPAANVIFNLGDFSMQMSGSSVATGTFLAFGKAEASVPPISIADATLNGAILAASHAVALSNGARVIPTCIAPAETAKIAAPAGKWTFVPFWDAFCADGTTTGIGVNLEPSSDKVLIYLEGGGFCWNDLTCYVLQTAANFTTGYGPKQFQGDLTLLNITGGFFDRTSPMNPFRDYNFVYIPYCTGDLHAGRNVVEYVSTTAQEAMFVGGDNFAAYLARLVPTFPKADHVVLAGSDAGGFGATLNWGATQTAFGSVEVDMIDDSGAFMPAGVGQPFPVLTDGAWNLTASLPSACASCATAGLAELYAYYAKSFPHDRGALLSYTQDSVLPAFYDITEGQFTAGLDKVLLTEFKPSVNLRYFTDAAQGHVLWFTPTLTSVGVSVETFVNEMVSGGTWVNVGPTP